MVLTEMSLDYSNRVLGSQKDNVKQMDRDETQQKENMLFSSQEFAAKLQKENMTLMKALAHRNKLVELSGIEIQKLRINLRSVQEKNLQLAQANSQMLAELNTNRDRLKEFQHELGCKNALLKVKKQLEEQALLCTHHESKDKVHDMKHKDTKRKRTPRIKPSVSADVKPIHVTESNKKANSKRRVSGVIDTTGIPEETCQTKDDIEKGVDNVVNKKFVPDAANPLKDSVHRKRQCTRRQSTRFDVQETEQTEKLLVMDDAKESKETQRLSLKRRSARLRPEEVEPCKSFREGDEVRETIKRRRVSSRLSARFDIQEPHATETSNADVAGSIVIEESAGSRSEAVEPSESRHDTKETNRKHSVSTRRQSTKGKSQTDEAIEEIATDPSLGNNIVQECGHEAESKDKPKADENEGMTRRSSLGRPSRHAAEKVQSYREVSLKVKMPRKC
ncbi:SHUGOSHIN 2 isoform X2 [Arabidopsis lyrata subsp. lyrata]|uniref:SHUGOSHIN 2 isoform X2 n=1 Tax=Arabidopsis lyrata subsp. lyrata TaxID=81972 RepID=UPI000A29C69C|nr:SHUGOSHIN 2 isoform X2 [Arabidopsis lyrata subsp. lyrata]|eukprot:XP_020878105.1 SHUGOSHIN 2 isoform X2 [Arabidopsis lyrata subsp. lyrata]